MRNSCEAICTPKSARRLLDVAAQADIAGHGAAADGQHQHCRLHDMAEIDLGRKPRPEGHGTNGAAGVAFEQLGQHSGPDRLTCGILAVPSAPRASPRSRSIGRPNCRRRGRSHFRSWRAPASRPRRRCRRPRSRSPPRFCASPAVNCPTGRNRPSHTASSHCQRYSAQRGDDPVTDDDRAAINIIPQFSTFASCSHCSHKRPRQIGEGRIRRRRRHQGQHIPGIEGSSPTSS